MYNSKIISQPLVDMPPLDICSDLRFKMYFESIVDKSLYLFIFIFFLEKSHSNENVYCNQWTNVIHHQILYMLYVVHKKSLKRPN
jgi:hypothetical protein